MARILLVEKSSYFRKLLRLNLELYTDAKVLNKLNGDDVIQFLKDDPDIQLIICENMVGNENTILKVFYYVNSQKLEIPIILTGQNPKLANEVQMVDKEDWKEIIKMSASLIGVTAEKMMEVEVPVYYPISVGAFLGIVQAGVPIYIVKNEEYEEIFSVEDKIDKSLIRELLLGKVNFLFVHKNDRLKFGEAFSVQMVEHLKSEDLDAKERIAATGAAFESVHNEVQLSGLSEQAIEVSKAAIESMVQIASIDPKLTNLLDMIQSSKDSYLYKHSLLVSTITHYIIGKMEWGNAEQQRKTSFIAFFHDITIPEDSLCSINSEKELNESELVAEDKRKVMNHALDACELLKDFKSIPMGAESIILQHHGSKVGVGFPEGQDVNISPLAIVFRIAEEYADVLLHTDKSLFKREAIFKMLTAKYDKGMYRKVVVALEEGTRS